MAEFYGHGGVCVASCYNQKCEDMREAVDLRGHSSCVTFTPGDDEKFALNYGVFIGTFAKNASRVFVIVGDSGEEGRWQQKETELLRDHGIAFEKLTLAHYCARYPTSGQMAFEGSMEGEMLRAVVSRGSSRTLADGAEEKGLFEGQALRLGRRRWPDGEVQEGLFSGAQASWLRRGTLSLAKGRVDVGTFVLGRGGELRLRRGCRSSPSGGRQEGEFFTGKELSFIRRGRLLRPGGEVWEGDFDYETARLARGVLTFPGGLVEEGERDVARNVLKKGSRRHPDGRVERVG